MKVSFLAVVVVVIFSSVAFGQGAGNIARRAAACDQRHADMLGRHKEQFTKAGQDLDKIGSTNYPVLCEYGKKVGMAQFEQKIVELKSHKGEICWSQIQEAVLASYEKIFANYKKNLEADCKKAEQIQPASQQATSSNDGPCGAVVSKVYEKGGFKNGNVKEREKIECIQVGNKCTYRITFVVLRTGLRHPLSETVEPGGTGKICVDNESQTLQYVRWKKWGTIGRQN